MANASAKASVGTKAFMRKPRKKRKGVVSKNKSSRNKNSKNYLKRYVGQGR